MQLRNSGKLSGTYTGQIAIFRGHLTIFLVQEEYFREQLFGNKPVEDTQKYYGTRR